MNNLATSTGFTTMSSLSMEETIKLVPNPAQNFTWDGIGMSSSKKEARIRDLVKKAIGAYLVDGLIRHSVDKYAEMFKDFNLDGEDAPVRYVESRLRKISVNICEHWKTFLTR